MFADGMESGLSLQIIATTLFAMSVAVVVFMMNGVQHLLMQIVGVRRHSRGLCFTCAYDLHGNVSGICPECGRQRSSGREPSH